VGKILSLMFEYTRLGLDKRVLNTSAKVIAAGAALT
jgi:hypothetical protein